MPAKIRMMIPNTNYVYKPNKFVRKNLPPTPANLGKNNIGTMPMIHRLANSRPCGSCGH